MQRIKEIQASLQNLSTSVNQLKGNITKLQQSLSAVQHFANGVERDIQKWQFKCKPRLNRIQIILDVLKIDQKSK